MTSTPVADVGSYFANFASAKATGSGNETANNFQDVLSRQTGGSTENADRVAPRTETKDTARERIGSKEAVVKPQRGSSLQEKTELTEEEISQAVEEAAAQMLVKTAQELNLTVDETEALLEELHLEPTDLLNPDTIPVLVLKAAGGTDMMELITNQELYTSVQSLLEELQTVEGNLMQETGFSEEELTQVLQNLTGAASEDVVDTEGLTDRNLKTVAEEAQPEAFGKETEETNPEITVVKRTPTEEKQEENLNRRQENNPFAQNLNPAGEAVKMAVTKGEAFSTGSTGQIMNQILDYMNVELQPDMTELEMQLHPESLGKVNVHISSREGVITAQFTAQNETVKAAIESQMVQLKENFTQQGIKVEAVEVTVENHGFERSMDQNGQTGAGGGEGKKSRPRKLQLDSLQNTEIEELSEEEQMAVRMMEQNGNTVDYTA